MLSDTPLPWSCGVHNPLFETHWLRLLLINQEGHSVQECLLRLEQECFGNKSMLWGKTCSILPSGRYLLGSVRVSCWNNSFFFFFFWATLILKDVLLLNFQGLLNGIAVLMLPKCIFSIDQLIGSLAFTEFILAYYEWFCSLAVSDVSPTRFETWLYLFWS